MLETIREFALERLVACGEEAATRERHAAWCIELAEWAEAAAWTREQGQRLRRLAVDYDNVRAALAWSLDAGETAIGIRLAAAMAQYWYIRGPLSEGLDWLTRALHVVEPDTDGSALRARVLFAAGLVAARQQDVPRSDAWLGESLELWHAAGHIRGEAEAVFFLALNRELREDRGDASGSLPLFTRALTLFRELDHPLEVDHPLMRHALLNLGWVTHKCGDDARALPLLEEAHALYEQDHDEWGLGISLDRLARVAQDRGEAARAAMLAAAGLRTFRQQHDQAGMLDALLCVASTAAMLGNPEPAGRILGAVRHLPDTIGVVPDVDFLARYTDGVAAVRATLGTRRTADLLVVGQALSLDQAVDAALALADELSTHARGPIISRDEHGGLSSREREVLRLIAAGQTNAEIASALFIAPRTVTTHASHILNKLGLESRSALIAYAHREGLI
jgi:DNA-binding CsgD family transcriptional regulator